MNGQIVSLVHKSTGRELLVAPAGGWKGGYSDEVPVPAQEWRVSDDSGDGLELLGELTPHTWYHHGKELRLHRAIRLDEDAPRLTIARTFSGSKLADNLPVMPNPTRFSSRWMFLVPDAAASVSVTGGGLDRTLALKDAEKEKLDVASRENQLVVTLDRGDGLRVRLSAPAEGFEAVVLDPAVAEKRLTVQLISTPHPMDRDAREIGLPLQVLDVETVVAPGIRPVHP